MAASNRSKSKYDVVVIGGGHKGLVNAAYLAKAGKKVLVLERRHIIGGAAVTEEIYPGFKFSVCSYVVSLLRPEIIRDLDLPRHGLEILPLDGTFTPMPNGDHLWRVNDHGQTHRDIARHPPGPEVSPAGGNIPPQAERRSPVASERPWPDAPRNCPPLARGRGSLR